MRNIKEVLRLKFDVRLGLRQIARSCSIGLGTAHESLQRAEAARITWPLGPEWDDDRLEAALFGGPVQQAHLFVAVLGTSSYTYAEATADGQLASWISAHVRAFEFYQGVPKLVVPDNTQTGVTKACRYDPDLNPTYQEMAMHYGLGVVPARPYKPRDKAKVESGVRLAERWIIAALRKRKFFSIEELNQANFGASRPNQPATVP